MSTEQSESLHTFTIDFLEDPDTGELLNPEAEISDKTCVAVVMRPQGYKAEGGRWSEEHGGYVFVRDYGSEEGEDPLPIMRQDIADFVESILDHINCDVLSLDEFGDYWMENCFLVSAECTEVEDSLIVYPRFVG